MLNALGNRLPSVQTRQRSGCVRRDVLRSDRAGGRPARCQGRRAAGPSPHRRRPAGRRGHVPYGCSRRVDPRHGGGRRPDRGRGDRAHSRAGRAGGRGRRVLHRQPWPSPRRRLRGPSRGHPGAAGSRDPFRDHGRAGARARHGEVLPGERVRGCCCDQGAVRPVRQHAVRTDRRRLGVEPLRLPLSRMRTRRRRLLDGAGGRDPRGRVRPCQRAVRRRGRRGRGDTEVRAVVELRPAAECTYDAVALGEVMLRLDPGEGRIRTTRTFQAWEGGGEYNVVRGLRRVFGLRGAVVTALVDNEVGRLVEDFILTGGLDTRQIVWVASDGVGRTVRNGLNFTERGFGVRGAVGVSDRGHTAISQLKPGGIDFDHLFGELGARWFHTGGIFAALSESAAKVAIEAVKAARKYGTVVSYDLNYRPSLWKAIGGQAKAQEVNKAIAPHVDVMIGNEEDFTAALGFEVEGVDEDLTQLPVEQFGAMIERVSKAYPNFQVIATTMRAVRSATVNDWGALAWSAESGLVQAAQRDGLEILDRVGGGDSFASGLVYGLLSGEPLDRAVNLGAAHGALAMTTPGDTSMATKAEVLKLAGGGSARVDR